MAKTTFLSRFTLHCESCGEDHPPGIEVYYDRDNRLRPVDCEQELPDPEIDQTEDKKIQVMPRGRTVKDRCMKCFQIPASNGVCGCE